jgi:hypothetical protein
VNPLTANFSELHQRHLCRHSQYGINAWHFAALVGTYAALFQIAFWLFGSWWVIPAIVIPYLVVVVPNIPLRLTGVVVAFLLIFFTVLMLIPLPWAWVDVVILALCYLVQNWSHRWYPVEFDMTQFKQKYRKGPAMFVLLTLYELPIQLNYLVFPSTRRRVGDQPEQAAVGWSTTNGLEKLTALKGATSAAR